MICKPVIIWKYKLTVLLCSISYFSFAQTNAEIQINTVFKQLVSVYGSAKSAPKLETIKKGQLPIPPAKYITTSFPTIEIDLNLYKVCQSFGKDSLNALAVVLSHELTHYFNDHTFCSDYAYASLYSTNPVLAKEIRNSSLTSRNEKETEADIKGFFFAAAAGFQPFGLQGQLIDTIYKVYNLPDVQTGYPTKQERKVIAKSAETEANKLFGYFKVGLKALEDKKYDEAISAFNNANGKIPFRENLNNMGVAKVRKALLLKLKTSEEYKFPDRFLYPIEVENKSRLAMEATRGVEDRLKQMTDLLISAQKDFEEAIRLDPAFAKGYINLACVYELLGKYNLALGTIEELTKEEQNSQEARRVLAIIYYHNKKEIEANVIWNELKI
jgi:tetratricopeptide (TPR) repeat protein